MAVAVFSHCMNTLGGTCSQKPAPATADGQQVEEGQDGQSIERKMELAKLAIASPCQIFAFRIPHSACFSDQKRVLSCPGTRARLGSETWPEAGARSTTWRPGPRGMLIARARCCKCEGLWGNIAADCAALASWCDLIIAIRAHFAARFPQRPFCPHRASNLGFGPAFRTSVPNPNPLPFPPLTAATP